MSNIVKGYTDYYTRSTGGMYPTEWLIRTFKGRYPKLKFNAQELKGLDLLEMGFGEGRNMPLFDEIGLRLHGVEISQQICDIAATKLRRYGIQADLRVGFNHATSFPATTFDCVVACHSFYYVTPGTTFKDNIIEANRILKPGGWFIADLVDSECYLFNDATQIDDGLYRCAKDPFGGIRDGALFQAFDSRDAIKDSFAPYFGAFSFGYQRNDFYGSQSNHHFLVCRKHQEHETPR